MTFIPLLWLSDPFWHYSLLFVAAFCAGVINSIAGGGTLVTFSIMVRLGMDPVLSNATNTFALAPGAMSSLYGYRGAMKDTPQRYFMLLLPSLLGAVLGAYLLRLTPAPVFARLVPFLILFATILMMVQQQLQRWLRLQGAEQQPATRQWWIGASIYQFCVAVYGGYFGAGIGILILASLGLLGLSNIHQMNGLKNLLAGSINLLAALYFVWAGLIIWPAAILMSVAAILGGYGAAGVAQRLSQQFVRRSVIAIGLAMSLALFFKQ